VNGETRKEVSRAISWAEQGYGKREAFKTAGSVVLVSSQCDIFCNVRGTENEQWVVLVREDFVTLSLWWKDGLETREDREWHRVLPGVPAGLG